MGNRELPENLEALYLSLLDEIRVVKAARDTRAYEELLKRAWDLVPEPKLEYVRGVTTMPAFVTHYRDVGRFAESLQWLDSMATVYGDDNPYIRTLRGTVLFEEGRLAEAHALLGGLFREYGARAFEGYDRKYLKFARTEYTLH